MSYESGLIDELRERAQKAEATIAVVRKAVESATFPPLPKGSHYLAHCERENDIGPVQAKAWKTIARAVGLEVPE